MPIYSRFSNLSGVLSLTVLLGSCIAPTVARSQATAESSPQTAAAKPESGTESKAVSSSPDGPLSPDDAEYQASEDALREHLKAMRVVRVDFHMTETPARDREYREKWAEMCDAGRPIFARARAAMIKKYSSDPVANAPLGALLYELLDRNVTDSRFEGMLEMGLALEKGGVNEVKLPALIALCAIAENEFELAKSRLETMPMESRPKLPILGAFVPIVDDMQKNWEEEQKLRAQDAQGEPLPQVKIRTTKGSCVVELFEDQAPEAVGNFIHLVEQGFYHGHTFHRVLEHFVAQTGCPEGDGTGGPGYTIYGEAEKPNARKFFRGTLGVALSNGDQNSGGSQFFICFVPAHNLNGKYTAFGRIVSGIEMIGNLTKVDPDDEKKKKEESQLLDEVIDITVIQKRNHPYEPNKVKS